MKPMTKIILTIGLTALMFSCGPGRKEMEKKEKASADSISTNGFISSSAAVETGKDTSHKFIRTAEMKFRVKSVVKATYQIEDITSKFNGFVTYTDLSSYIDEKNITSISVDSSVETIHFTVSNSMTLRVPNIKLDSTLKTIATLIEYLDYRRIKADDVKLQILSNQLTQQRVGKHEERLKTAIDTRGRKLNETTTAEENLLNKQEQADNSKVSNLSLQDQINFSTVSLSIYQRQEAKRWIISNDKNIDAYRPNLGKQIIESLKFGWDILEALLVFIIKLWGLILIAIIVYILYKIFRRKFKINK
jgi:hypothetical protein